MELGSPIEAGKTAYLVESVPEDTCGSVPRPIQCHPLDSRTAYPPGALMVARATYFRVRDRLQNNRK